MVTFYTKSTAVKENMRDERGSKGNKKIQEAAVRFPSALFVFVFFLFNAVFLGPLHWWAETQLAEETVSIT